MMTRTVNMVWICRFEHKLNA